MRCKACNSEMPVSFRFIAEIDSSVLETCCPKCLFMIRSSLYDGIEADVMSDVLVEVYDDNEATE